MTLAGWLLIVMAAVEIVSRSVARQRFLPAAAGGAWPTAALVAIAAVTALIVFTSASRPRRGLARGTPLLFAVLFCAGVSAQLALEARLQSDGFYYFAYLRSLAFDGDVDFTNDYRLLGQGDKAHLFEPTPTNHAQSAWTIGPAILWSPFFAVGHLVARELSAWNPQVSTDGLSFPYRQAVCLGGLAYGLLGCWFMFRLTCRVAGRPIAAGATVMTVAGSFMLWYLVKEPTMTHAPSMALVAGFAWAWAATRERRTPLQWALLGLLAGAMTLVRWQNALFALLPACDSALLLARAWRARDRGLARSAVATGLLFTAAAILAFLPQMLAWQAIYGRPLAVSPIGPQMRFFDPRIIDILWSSRNGLFSTSPALYVGALGLLLLARTHPALGIPSLLVAGVMTWFNASVQDWWGSAGYGGRRFDGLLPFFCLGLACVTEAALGFLRRAPWVGVAAGGTALVLWNLTLMAGAQAGAVRLGESVSFGDTMAIQARTFHSWFGNPFTYPTSLVYGLRHGLPPGRYDLLSANRLLADPLQPHGGIDIGRSDAWVMEAGWHAPEQEGPVTFRWASADALLLLSLDRVADLRVEIRLRPLGYQDAPGQRVTLVVNGQEHGPIALESGWQTITREVPAGAWRAGVNRVRLRFAWDVRPADLGLGEDPRRLSAAVDYIRVAIQDLHR